jgi:hypothetical protein
MSHAPLPHDVHGHAPAATTANPEAGVNVKLIVGVGVVSLVIFAVSAVIAWVMLDADTETYEAAGAAPKAPLIGSPEIGIVDQAHFEDDTRLGRWREGKKQRLESYGWVDRKQGLIHIPIGEAMKEVVRQSGGGGGR